MNLNQTLTGLSDILDAYNENEHKNLTHYAYNEDYNGTEHIDVKHYAYNEDYNGTEHIDMKDYAYSDDYNGTEHTNATDYAYYEEYDYSEYYKYDENGSYIEGHHDNSSQEYLNVFANHYLFTFFPFEVVVLGYIRPILIIITALTNALVISVFLSKKSRGKSTNLLFVSIAISDTLTGLVLLPNSFYIYASDRHLLTLSWCKVSVVMRFYVSRVFHTVSNWQTVLLGVQRFLCVCHPFISSRICTFWKTLWMIGLMYLLAMVLHVYHLTREKIWLYQCNWHTESPCKETCAYMWFCTFFEHLFPVVFLVYLTFRTISSLKKATRRVSVSSRSSAASRKSRDKLISITATCIVIVFLVPELPHGIYKLVLTSLMQRGDKYLHVEFNHIIIAVYEILVVVSFHLNFWIYCIMMRDFRKRMFTIVTFGCLQKYFGGDKYLSDGSSSSHQGTSKTKLSRTNSTTSTKNHIIVRNVSLRSTGSEINNLHAQYPGNFQKFARATSDISNGTSIPLLTMGSRDEDNVGKPEWVTQMSKESAYLSWEGNEAEISSPQDGQELPVTNTNNEEAHDDDVFL